MQRRAVTPDAALDGRTKGLPAGVDALAPGAIASRGWNVLREDLPLPLALLKASSLDHNARWMRAFREAVGVALAPHGKTSMSPELFRRQLADGAWGITVATVQQLRVARDAGVARVLMANQLVGRQAIAYVLDELARDPDFAFFAVVDSVDLVDSSPPPHARGRRDGRCRCSSSADSPEAVPAAVRWTKRWRWRDALPQPRLAAARGRGGLRGLRCRARRPRSANRASRAFVAFMAEVARAASTRDWSTPIRCCVGGRLGVLRPASRRCPAPSAIAAPRSSSQRLLLTHDSDSYAQGRGTDARADAGGRGAGRRLARCDRDLVVRPVRPEPSLAILTMGKRDVSHDLHLPFARMAVRPGADRHRRRCRPTRPSPRSTTSTPI
jgi:D-serine dehydratase